MSDQPALGKITLEALEAFLRPSNEKPRLAGYKHAAAVLAAFDPFTLCPSGEEAELERSSSIIDELLPSCEVLTTGPEAGLWSLTLPNRRSALRDLATREKMRAALEANPKRLMTPLQRVWEERVLGTASLELHSLTREELAALSTLRDWVEDILDNLPSKEAIHSAIRQLDLLAPMRRLAERGFVGREAELAHLEQYVSSRDQHLPLFVFGSGGVGKSTLLSRFVLTHLVPQHYVVAYLDLDRSTVRPDIPQTLLLEALSQFRAQLETYPTSVQSLINEITSTLSRMEAGRHLESAGVDMWLLQRFAAVTQQWLGSRRPAVIVDTMEEAQFLGADVMYPLVDFLFRLREQYPGLSVMLSGRTLPWEYVDRALYGAGFDSLQSDQPEILDKFPPPARPLNLGVLQTDPARQLLREAIEAAGIPALAEEELDEIIGIVSSNPMCLHLAVRLLKEEGIGKLRSQRSEFFSKLRSEKIQALLYSRILGHLHCEDVQKVAYPGLIVRRIDADVIREVLGGPCGLEFTPERDEYAILADLSREAALVERDPADGSLRHRVDVRRAMLEDLLEHVDARTVEAIDNAAVTFYEPKPGGIARAEEIYHRLRREDPESTLDNRWMVEATRNLQSALDEVPVSRRTWLANKLGVTLDQSAREAADLDAWERQVARSAERHLLSRQPEKALAILHERPERSPRSPLYLLEAEAYRFLAAFDDALRVARQGVDSATKAGAIDMALDLLLKMVVIEEVRGSLEAADHVLNEAAAVAAHTHNKVLQLRVKVTRLRLQRQLQPAMREERAALREEALAIVREDGMMQILRDHPVLLREVAAELAKQDAQVASAAIETLGAEVQSDEQAQALGHAIAATFKEAQSEGGGGDPELLKGVEEFEKSDFDPNVIRKWITEELTARAANKIGGALAGAGKGASALSSFRKYFRAGVDSTLRGISGFDID